MDGLLSSEQLAAAIGLAFVALPFAVLVVVFEPLWKLFKKEGQR